MIKFLQSDPFDDSRLKPWWAFYKLKRDSVTFP